MSKPSRRPGREELKAQKKERALAQKALYKKHKAEGFKIIPHTTNSNSKCTYKNTEEERLVRNETATGQFKFSRAQLPILMAQLSKIPDPRNPNKISHKLTVLMIYGILSFVLHMASSREATREMSRPMFWENLRYFFPELGEETPHHNTLRRLLSGMDVNEITNIQLELIKKWIRQKKFKKYLVNGCYPVAMDGTQKMTRDCLWDEECLQRTFNKGESNEKTQYYVYVMQANLAFKGGISIPIMSEFLCYSEGDSDRDKQDCELKAFYRLSDRLKKAFPALPIIVLLDGLYAKGPVFEKCRKNKWQFMIVLKDDSLPSVMKEFEAIAKLEPGDRHSRIWGRRRQHFKWVNDIEYYFGPNGKKCETIHVVECLETWEEIEKGGAAVEEKSSRHVWISSAPLDRLNLHDRCNLAARARWTIETGFLVEKHHGYQYEHCFAYNWNAMIGYHNLMQLGHTFNIMAQFVKLIVEQIKDLGMRGLIHFVRETLAGPWLDRAWIVDRLGLAIPLSCG
jgi:hypothetical protein